MYSCSHHIPRGVLCCVPDDDDVFSALSARKYIIGRHSAFGIIFVSLGSDHHVIII